MLRFRYLTVGGPRIIRPVSATTLRILFFLCMTGLLAGRILYALLGQTATAQEQPLPTRPTVSSTGSSSLAPKGDPPQVRIGLSVDPLQVKLFGSGGVRILDPKSGKPAWKPQYDEPVVVALDLPKGIRPRSVFRIQVGSFSSQPEAEALKNRLEELLPDPVIISYSPDRNVYRVRVGQFERRDDASFLTEKLLDEGFTELWVSEEPGPSSGRARLRLVDSRYYSQVVDPGSLLVLPVRSEGRVQVDGNPYRGSLEIRILGDGIKVINELDIEEYLRGVVPNELGPDAFPELEALKAQAVAARTYIVANTGQFDEFGYDICDTPACQVYKGFATEHSLTDQAVEETRGIVASFEGEPIKALYTSTCGGHTEDGVNVFGDLKFPYLKGVDCYPESAAPTIVEGVEELPAAYLPTGGTLGAEVGVLVVLGVVGAEVLQEGYLDIEATEEEALEWWRRAFRLIGAGSVPQGFQFDSGSRLEWSRFLVRAFKWQERAKLALDDRDLPYLLGAEAEQIPTLDRRGVGILLNEGIFRALPDGSLDLGRRPSRAMVLAWLYRVADHYGALPLRKGSFRGQEGRTLRIREEDEGQDRPLAEKVFLYRTVGEGTYPAAELALAVGDPLSYHLDADGRVDAMVLEPSIRGASDDRFSTYYQWEVRYTRKELEEQIRKRINIGRLKDIAPTKWGVSGRVIQVKIRGSRGTFTLNGFKIRTALGIRENLFTIERQIDPGGGIRAFTLAGKGWGHGVGMCQVGAYGMAMRGESFDRILAHYYTGIKLVHLYN